MSCATIELTRGKFALVDWEDLPLVENHEWCAYFNPSSGLFYARTGVYAPELGRRKIKGFKFRTVAMHRLIMDVTDPKIFVDHINHDTLDNRRSNLRLANNSQNQGNRLKGRNNISGFKGVSWYSRDGVYRAQISINGKGTHIGYYDTAEDAARAYDKVARSVHGEFALVNFGDGGDQCSG